MNKKQIAAIWIALNVSFPFLYYGMLKMSAHNWQISSQQEDIEGKIHWTPIPREQMQAYNIIASERISRVNLKNLLVVGMVELVSITGLAVYLLGERRK